MNHAFGIAKLAALAVSGFLAMPAFGQATRTWVSGVGDDANPCSRTAPCKTFAGAISKTAAKGEIDALDPGGYGAVTITKSITITGVATQAGILTNAGSGIVVNAAAGDVVILRNLALEGLGTATSGIRFIAGADLHVENVTVQGFGQGIDFNPSGASKLFVKDSSFRNNFGGGMYIRPSGTGLADATIDRVVMQGNLRGIRAEDGAAVTITNSDISGNDFSGVVAAGVSRPVTLTLENCVANYNGTAGVWSGALATVRLMNNLISRNLTYGVRLEGGLVTSYGSNRIWGNNGQDVSNGSFSFASGI